jgi:hypothetical protein
MAGCDCSLFGTNHSPVSYLIYCDYYYHQIMIIIIVRIPVDLRKHESDKSFIEPWPNGDRSMAFPCP